MAAHKRDSRPPPNRATDEQDLWTRKCRRSTILEASEPGKNEKKKGFALVATLILKAGLMLIAVPQALVACHAFTVSASPSPVDEGGSVTVTVRRDAAVNPSNISVETVNESAIAGQDYTGIQKQPVNFTEGTTRRR